MLIDKVAADCRIPNTAITRAATDSRECASLLNAIAATVTPVIAALTEAPNTTPSFQSSCFAAAALSRTMTATDPVVDGGITIVRSLT